MSCSSIFLRDGFGVPFLSCLLGIKTTSEVDAGIARKSTAFHDGGGNRNARGIVDCYVYPQPGHFASHIRRRNQHNRIA